jgi:chloride channel 3/4/5
MWQSFVSAMVAAVTLQAMNPFRTGKLVLYQVTYSSGWHGFEIIPFALLGIIGVGPQTKNSAKWDCITSTDDNP